MGEYIPEQPPERSREPVGMCMQKNTTQVRNMKQYLLAVLFNAPTTMNNHFTSLVNHDMHAGGW